MVEDREKDAEGRTKWRREIRCGERRRKIMLSKGSAKFRFELFQTGHCWQSCKQAFRHSKTHGSSFSQKESSGSCGRSSRFTNNV